MPMFDFSPRMQACSRGGEYLRDSEWICEKEKKTARARIVSANWDEREKEGAHIRQKQ